MLKIKNFSSTTILSKALIVTALTVVVSIATSLAMHYSHDKALYVEQVQSELQRQAFALKTELTTVLKSGNASELRRKLVSHENLFSETEIVVFNGGTLLGSSLTLAPNVQLSEHFIKLGLDPSLAIDASGSRLNKWQQGNLHIVSIPICMSPLTYSKYLPELKRCTSALIVKSIKKKMEDLQRLYVKISLTNIAIAAFFISVMTIIATNYWRRRTKPTFEFLEQFKVTDNSSQIINKYNDELSLLERQINKLVDRTRREQNLLKLQANQLVARANEVEEQKLIIQESNHQLQVQANTDPLTGLLNRFGLSHSEKIKRDLGGIGKRTLYIFDIDFFKSVNDEYSHTIGDKLLYEVAVALRSLCDEEDVLCRFGGEEFLVLKPWKSNADALEFASVLQHVISSVTVQSGDDHVSRTVSIGLVELEDDATIESGFTLADMALLEAKRRGRNQAVLVNNDFIEEMRRTGSFITAPEVEAAILNNEFKYYCQPIQNSKLGRPEGYEALIRWVKPTGEIIPPSVFLHTFQKVFFDKKFKGVRRKMRKDLVNSFHCVKNIYFSWNYDLDQLEDNAFVASILRWSNDLRKETACEIVIEISENALYREVDMSKIINNLKRLRSADIGIALDDFGVEHSNVQRLTELPISIIKLDRCLIQRIDDKPENLSTILHIANLAHELDIKVIAEGVESDRHVMLLDQCGIHSHQGFYYSKPYDPAKKPINAHEIPEVLDVTGN